MKRPCTDGLALFVVVALLASSCRTDSRASDSSGASDRPSESQTGAPAQTTNAGAVPDLAKHLPDSDVSDCATLADSEDETHGDTDTEDLSPFRATGAVATVDGTSISAEAFNRHIAERFGGSETGTGVPRRMAESMKSETVRSVVEAILIDRSLDDHPHAVSPPEIREELRAFQDRFPSDRALASFLETRALSPGELLSELCRDMRLRALLADNYDIAVDADRVREHYEEHSNRYEEPAKVRASHILIELPRDASEEKISRAEKRAAELAEKARGGSAKFAELARKHSDGPSADAGGDLGYFARDRMVEDFAEAAFSAEPGDIVGPVRTKFGYHVIHVRDRRAAETRSFDEVRDSIRNRLERRNFRKALDEYKSDLRTRHDIELHPDRVEVTVDRRDDLDRTSPDAEGLTDEKQRHMKQELDKMMRRPDSNRSPDPPSD